MPFKLLTINARGLGSSLSNNVLFDYIEKSGCHICFVQETLISSDNHVKLLSAKWSGQSSWSPALGKQGSTAVLISDNCDANVISWKRDSKGRIISLLIRIDGVNFNLVNIYAPTNLSERKSFFDSLHEFFSLPPV